MRPVVALKFWAACGAWVLLLCGCGSFARLIGGDGGATRTASGPSRTTRATQGKTVRLLGTYLVSVDPSAGTMRFTPLSDGSASSGSLSRRRRGVRLQATNYGPADRLQLSGTATHSGGELSGTVTISTTNRVTFSDVKAVIASISNSSVTVKNPSGTTTLTGSSRPYYDHGQVAAGNPSARTWTFVNASAVSFTFRVMLFANVWNYAVADGSPVGGVFFISSTTGWAVGGGGKIFKTEDGGATWRPQNAALTRGLNDVFFVDASRGWIVGDAGTILVTTNGGRTWETQTSPVTVNLNGVRFLNASQGWIVGNFDTAAGRTTILATTNGGASWSRVMAPLPEANLFGLDVTNDGGTQLTAVGVGNQPTILRSTDGGTTWTAQSPPPALDPIVSLQAVEFVNASIGWIVGTFGTVLSTTNGGATWTQRAAPVGSANLYAVAFPNTTVGWAVGQGSVLIKSTDGGNNWLAQVSPVQGDLNGLAVLANDTQRAWAVGAGGALILTTNGGSTWTAASASSNAAYNAVDFVNSSQGWIVGANGTMLRTTNGGLTWTRMTGTTRTLRDVDFVNATHGWAVGDQTTVLRTTDGGASWSTLSLPSGVSGTFNGVKFISPTTGWVVGYGANGTTGGGIPFNTGLYLKTTDGGATWQARPTPAEPALPALAAVDFADADTGWIVGSGGHIMKTVNGGTTWSTQSSPVAQGLLAIKAIDANRACAVGQAGRIIRTNDGGANWFEQFSGVTVELTGVEFVDANRGWVTGATRTLLEGGTPVTRETLLRTTNGGLTWTPVDTYSNTRLNGLIFLNADDGWIVGANGLIKRFH